MRTFFWIQFCILSDISVDKRWMYHLPFRNMQQNTVELLRISSNVTMPTLQQLDKCISFVTKWTFRTNYARNHDLLNFHYLRIILQYSKKKKKKKKNRIEFHCCSCAGINFVLYNRAHIFIYLFHALRKTFQTYKTLQSVSHTSFECFNLSD